MVKLGKFLYVKTYLILTFDGSAGYRILGPESLGLSTLETVFNEPLAPTFAAGNSDSYQHLFPHKWYSSPDNQEHSSFILS